MIFMTKFCKRSIDVRLIESTIYDTKNRKSWFTVHSMPKNGPQDVKEILSDVIKHLVTSI